MRRKRSDELPRFVRDAEPHFYPFQRHRRYWYYLAGVLFVCWILYPSRKPVDDGNTLRINWSSYAYSLYATDSATLCHAVLIFDALAKYGSKADRVLFYPRNWDTVIANSRDRDSQLLVMARDKYNVRLQPIELLTVEGRTTDAWTGTWDKSVTKFMAFSLAYYDRVIALDSDITLLQSLDELFLLPPTPIAMPRAYWYESAPRPLTSLLMVIKPDLAEFERFKSVISGGGNPLLVNAHKFDMELVNDRFEESALVLPHRPYALLTGEFRRHRSNHSAYLGNAFEAWDAETVLKEAKLVHFSDWPLPKPWIMWPLEGLAEVQPDCEGSHEGSCPERRIWKHLYEDFRARRKEVCRLLSVPAPEWWKIKGGEHHPNVTEGTAHEAPHAEGEIPSQSTSESDEQSVVHDV
ncbi:glycosyltransferase family 8 protein [Trematosphaeria pertusa]|uniref:Glycosyltransferase family 8 protein n=1 Tax=Trematosphaeria pertusa TaxID=390896 RepID=A0A6A6IQD0_9PLEO|nr:glycosyltransferase family 8 protein [Trematosphaeria pertusa]KAF2252447.1 glycosyltransferase family 8 protein [Trematosphaeria pertusa]